MNSQPHTHDPVVSKPDVRYVLTYGDTVVKFFRSQSMEKMLKRAVYLHDEGSKKAGRKVNAPKELTALARNRIREAKEVWGEEVLVGTKILEPSKSAAELLEEQLQEREVSRRKQQDRQWEMERSSQKRREDAISEVRVDHWRQGRPEEKVKVDEYGEVVSRQFQPGWDSIYEQIVEVIPPTADVMEEGWPR